MIAVDVTNQQSRLGVDADNLRTAVEVVLKGEEFDAATVSVAVVDDQTIHDLNRRFLDHDYPTDVLSFLLSEPGAALEGEVVVSADTADRQAGRYDCLPAEELLRYLIHGTLHLAGYDDASDEQRTLMRAKENGYLRVLGSKPDAERSPSGPLPPGARDNADGEPSS